MYLSLFLNYFVCIRQYFGDSEVTELFRDKMFKSLKTTFPPVC